MVSNIISSNRRMRTSPSLNIPPSQRHIPYPPPQLRRPPTSTLGQIQLTTLLRKACTEPIRLSSPSTTHPLEARPLYLLHHLLVRATSRRCRLGPQSHRRRDVNRKLSCFPTLHSTRTHPSRPLPSVSRFRSLPASSCPRRRRIQPKIRRNDGEKTRNRALRAELPRAGDRRRLAFSVGTMMDKAAISRMAGRTRNGSRRLP